jgi:nucleotide-binding universal stress UspA family protein
MFEKILNANDGSPTALRALSLALALAKQHNSELHMVCVEELPYMPEFVEEVDRRDSGAERRIKLLVEQSKAMAEKEGLKLAPHVLKGHPVRDIVRLATQLEADLLVIGAVGHSVLYERLIGSRADRIVQLSPCPVLVAK